jgi:hemoglobin
MATHRPAIGVPNAQLEPMSAPLTPYDQIGGDAAVRQLVDRFYDLMDASPEATHARALHATSLKSSREKLYMFLTGWLGGPPLYVEKHGHPRLRQRHFPFAISSRERDQWLWCMDKAMAEQPMPPELHAMLKEKLHALADHMRNHPDSV